MEIRIDEVVEHASDLDWLDKHAKIIIRQFTAGLKQEDTSTQFAIALLYLIPHIIHSDNIKHWSRLMEQAVRRVVDAPVVKYTQTHEPEYLIENRYVIKRLDHRSVAQLTEPKRRSRIRVNPRQYFEQFLLLSLTLFFRGQITLTWKHVDQYLSLARQVNNYDIYCKCYQAVALILYTIGEYKQAQRFAWMSLEHYRKQHNDLEAAISAHLLAATFRAQGQTDAAGTYQQAAESYISNTSYEGILANMLS